MHMSGFFLHVPEDIQEKLKNFRVGEIGGEFVCCLALRNFGGGLYEVRSLAVRREYNNRGIGSKLVQGAIDHLKAQGGPCRVFALTIVPIFSIVSGSKLLTRNCFRKKSGVTARNARRKNTATRRRFCWS